ncbi:MAG: tetratricopeptide repeat protein [Planctomycetaceae bacterium]|nr:tetratricopeptide repeat protein [Planctomycetaceae bacterium]
MRISRCLTLTGLSLMTLGVSLLQSGCNQTSGYVMNESGKGLYARGNYTAARREFEKAMMDSPENPNYAFNVASAMRKQGDLIGAERMYERALTLDPRHQPAHHELASMLKEQGREDQAAAHIQEWVATQPYQPNAHVEQAWMQQQQGDLVGAEQSLQMALRQKPNHPTAMAQLGDVYLQTGRQQQADTMYRRSLAMNPFQSEVRTRVSRMQRPNQVSPQAMAAYSPPPQYVSQAATPIPFAAPIQQVSYDSQLSTFPQAMPGQPVMQTQPAQYPVMQAGGIPQSFAPQMAAPQTVNYPMAPAPAYQPTTHTAGYPSFGSVSGPLVNAAPQQGQMMMSNTPIVSPF